MERDISWPVCWRAKKPSSSDCRCAYMRLRRSSSTPSETRPDTSRRTTDSTTRPSAASTTRPAYSFRSSRSPRVTASMPRPVSHGMATVAAIANAASTSDQAVPARYGRRKPSRRTKVLTGSEHITWARSSASECARLADRMADDAISLRNRFAMVKGAWDENLRGVAFPSLGEGTAEQKIERLEIALVDEMRARATPESAEQVADAMWSLVHNRDDGDPVKQRVTQHHEELARLGHRGLR